MTHYTPNARRSLLDTVTLSHGTHADEDGYCALEAIHYVAGGVKSDDVPHGLSPLLAVLSPLNDGPWRDDAHRTAVLRPYLPRLLALRADPARDQVMTYQLADYARLCAAEALESGGFADEADTLRDIAPITDQATAEDAAWATRADAWATAWAAGSAARTAVWAVFERHAHAMLGIILQEVP